MNGIDRDELRALLGRSEIFAGLRGRRLDALAREMAWFSLPGGAPLFEAGDASDALYVVKAGSLGVFGKPRSGGAPRLLGVVPRGSTLGELGLVTGQPRESG
ncbi:MAG TPA: cyclic nucleotide-binding domain-containing protein, partial [Rhodanobacteraceae bacterium]|nr:cyclic nucleotide-binding domain-containing protein [Rhodanobacteraceae bacterium]